MSMRTIVDITGWETVAVEPGGAEEKVWVTPRDEQDEDRWLFKPTKSGTLRGKKGAADSHFLRGNVWAESISYQVGIALVIPMAQTEIALRGVEYGTISRNVRPRDWDLHGGSVRLGDIAPEYRPRTHEDKRPDRIGHNLSRIQETLVGVKGPPGSTYDDWPAFEIFASYLLLDALIGNQDRHEDNWAILTSPKGRLHLSAAFDHGSALSAGMHDRDRARVLANGNVEQWCANGLAKKVERFQGKAPTLVALAYDALTQCSRAARAHWGDRLKHLTSAAIDEIVDTTPHMSEVARTLTREILRINKERLLQCLAES